MNKLEYSKEDLIEMQNDIDKLQQENKQLKERIDKAIEYIKRVCDSENDVNPYILHAPTLLNILKEVSK